MTSCHTRYPSRRRSPAGAGHLMVRVRDAQTVDRVEAAADPLLAVLRSANAEGCYVYAFDEAAPPDRVRVVSSIHRRPVGGCRDGYRGWAAVRIPWIPGPAGPRPHARRRAGRAHGPAQFVGRLGSNCPSRTVRIWCCRASGLARAQGGKRGEPVGEGEAPTIDRVDLPADLCRNGTPEDPRTASFS